MGNANGFNSKAERGKRTGWQRLAEARRLAVRGHASGGCAPLGGATCLSATTAVRLIRPYSTHLYFFMNLLILLAGTGFSIQSSSWFIVTAHCSKAAGGN